MDVQRGKRLTGKRVTWAHEERERISKNAREFGIPEDDIVRHVTKRKLAHPASAGWTPWVYGKTKKVKGKSGKPDKPGKPESAGKQGTGSKKNSGD